MTAHHGERWPIMKPRATIGAIPHIKVIDVLVQYSFPITVAPQANMLYVTDDLDWTNRSCS